MTYDEVRTFAFRLPGVADGTAYGRPCLKAHGKFLTRLFEAPAGLRFGLPASESEWARLAAAAGIGGPVTLFKGLDEMQQLAFSQVFSVSDYLLFAVIKLAALVVAAACGFRGGRIFPAVFVGVALGLMLHEHVDAVPAAITVSCSILGLVLVVTRDAWLSLFMAAVVVPDTTLIPLLCIVMLPAWLLLAGKPMMMAWRNDK